MTNKNIVQNFGFLPKFGRLQKKKGGQDISRDFITKANLKKPSEVSSSRLKDEVEWASDFARYSSEGKFEKTERGRELFENPNKNIFLLILILFFIFLLPNISAACNESQININAASLEELDALSGIGPVKAQAIIDTRPFSSIDDLINVNGIGEITLNNIKLQGLACISGETTNPVNETQNNTDATINKTSSPSIEVNYSEKVYLNQEFSFKIKLINFDDDIYDVKIDILSNENRISEILNENIWKSTSYYVNNIINPNAEKEFLMKITKEFENAEITIKIKDSSEKTTIFSNYSIYRSNAINNQTNSNETQKEQIYQNTIENSKPENKTTIITGSATANTEDIKSGENTEKLNKNDYAKYILTAFAFLIALLFLLKNKFFKKEYKNEFKG